MSRTSIYIAFYEEQAKISGIEITKLNCLLIALATVSIQNDSIR